MRNDLWLQCHKLSTIALYLSGEQYYATSEERVVRVLPTGTNTAQTVQLMYSVHLTLNEFKTGIKEKHFDSALWSSMITYFSILAKV